MTNVRASVINLNPIVIGSDAVYVITFPYSIAGNTYEAKVQKEAGSVDVAAFEIETDGVNNRVTISLTNVVTSQLTVALRKWYLKETNTLNEINVTHRGKVRIIMP